MVKAQSILDKSLSKGKAEVNLSTFAVLFSEIIAYVQQRVKTTDQLHDKLVSLGKSVGIRMLDLIVLREKGYKRETRLLGMLMFLKSTVWKNLFGKEADRLERANDDPHTYLLIEKEPLVNAYISLPKDKAHLNCAAFSAGIVEAMLEASNFPCKVGAHWHEGATTYLIKFEESFVPKEITTIPANLHSHLFPHVPIPSSSADVNADPFLSSLQLPTLRDSRLLQHFEALAREQVGDYVKLMDEMLTWDLEKYYQLLPGHPGSRWAYQYRTGWTRYDHQTGKTEQVPYPREQCCVFDLEVSVADADPGQIPTLGLALSNKAWYSWCSARLIRLDFPYPKYITKKNLVQLSGGSEDTTKRLIVGHNIGYDRARSQEPYLEKRTGIRYMDTMCMGVSMYGMADHQQGLYNKDDIAEPTWSQFMRKPKDLGEIRKVEDQWRPTTTRVALTDLSRFLVNKHQQKDQLSEAIRSLSKSTRNDFVNYDVTHFREGTGNFEVSMDYCAKDVLATAKIFQLMWPVYKEMYPSPISTFGYLNMGDARLPINKNWPLFYKDAEDQARTQKTESSAGYVAAARELYDSADGSDLWLWTEDWDQNKKGVLKWFASIVDKAEDCEAALAGRWVSTDWSPTRTLIFGMAVGPYPLFNHREYGWGFLVPPPDYHDLFDELEDKDQTVRIGSETLRMPLTRILKAIAKWSRDHKPEDVGNHLDLNALTKDEKLLHPLIFYQLPRSDAAGKKVTKVSSPFQKAYRPLLINGTIRATRFEQAFQKALQTVHTTHFWGNYKKRYKDEIQVWNDDAWEAGKMPEGALAPGIRPAGTVSRRAVHNLWVTLTNVKSAAEDRIGTHLKSMVQAPLGYCFVGADVDSQEQWLAALFGDASDAAGLDVSERRAGRTPFSNMALAGQRSDNSDLHSVVAKDLGIPRDTAKVLNYARLYGAGKENAKGTLRQSGIDGERADELATVLLETTKGRQIPFRRLKPMLIPFFEQYAKEKNVREGFLRVGDGMYLPEYGTEGDLTYNFEQWIQERLQAQNLKSAQLGENVVPSLYLDYPTTEKFFVGGYESPTFNFLLASAREDVMRTPVLKATLGAGLAVPETSRGVGRILFRDSLMRSRQNWIVQSSAVDFLHLLLLSMEWLCSTYKIDARFMISIHDEVRYVCHQEDAARCALALMLSNMYVRATISDVLGIPQLPLNIAFFSQVDVDTVLRKEVKTVCRNPDGGSPPDGEAWDIAEVLRRTGGRLDKQ
ncbi:unnamed protein product, partial [Mesorhabditis spiculigera]